MTTSYAQHFSTKATPQSEPIPGSKQVPNSAGGFAFPVDDWTRLDRFLVLGNEGGSYYATERALTIENAKSVQACLKEDGPRAIARIAEISKAGRAPKNDPAIFALALAAGTGDAKTKEAALAALSEVCRIGTHLFQFAEAVQAFRGWGRGLRKAIGQWYAAKEPEQLAYQLVKYQSRNGWSHRDLLRLCHVKAAEPVNTALRWAVGKAEMLSPDAVEDSPLTIIQAFEKAKRTTEKKEICKLVRQYNLPRECVPTQFLTEAEVWDALLDKMPLTAMIRNLATMTRVGLLAPMSLGVGKVIAELANVERLRKSRIHPVGILAALLTYKQGHGERGQNTWSPVAQIVDALDGAFYQAFGNVEPTGKRWLLGLDVSGSMNGTIVSGMPFLPAVQAEAAMALITAATEPQHAIVAFDTEIKSIAVSPRQRLDDATGAVQRLIHGGTNCALPIAHALQQRIPVDVFAIYTDSETWQGNQHPVQAIAEYRNKMGIPAKLIVIALAANNFSIAGPDDGGMMNVVGFDTNAPQVMSEFVR